MTDSEPLPPPTVGKHRRFQPIHEPIALLLLLLLAVAVTPERSWRFVWRMTVGRWGRYSTADRLREFETPVRTRLAPALAAAGFAGWPEELRLIMLKQEKRLEVEGRAAGTAAWRLIRPYAVPAASGGPGPKLREGDRQVPEGSYRIESLHPNSYCHLALKMAYPSLEDRELACRDGRDGESLGDLIMIHGRGGSIGCVAVSDRDIEAIFVLAVKAKAGVERIALRLLPYDFRGRPLPPV